MSPDTFRTYLEIAKELGVRAFKVEDMAVEFAPPEPDKLDDFGEPVLDKSVAGGWKRHADLSEQE